MTNDAITHERCSELLADYAAGRLDAAEVARVDAHLEHCADCAAELRAVMALRVEDEPLSELERARLHKGIADRLDEGAQSRPRDVVAFSPRRTTVGARLAAALGAAALIAIGGVALVSLTSGGGDDTPGAASGIAEEGGADRADDSTGTTSGGGGVAAEGAAPAAPRPSYDGDAGNLSSGKLNKLGRKNSALSAFSNSYSANDAARLKDDYVDELADQAGDPGQRALIRTCADEVYAAQPYAALPAYAARGRFDGQPALVLGFAWTDEDAGPLDQFMLWTWPESSCDQPIDYRAGRIGRRK